MVQADNGITGTDASDAFPALLSVLRAARLSPEAGSVPRRAVEAIVAEGLAETAWLAADPDRVGRVAAVAAAGAGAEALAGITAGVGEGVAPWEEACRLSGRTLAGWLPLASAHLPGAHLGLAHRADDGHGLAAPLSRDSLAEIALEIGQAVDARTDRDLVERLLIAVGRGEWLEANRALSRSIRHDLGNILTGISFFGSHLASELPERSSSADDADAIVEAVARAGRLVVFLQELWAEPADDEVLPLDPATAIHAITPVLEAVVEPCRLRVGPLASVAVRASRRLLEEALLAMVVNAREAAGARDADIAVTIELVLLDADDAAALGLPPGRYAALSVADDGPGMPADVLARAAEPFFTTHSGAAGLGLAMASAGARALGGALRIESAAGAGTSVALLLPQAAARPPIPGDAPGD